jgi:MscS family membrane protein
VAACRLFGYCGCWPVFAGSDISVCPKAYSSSSGEKGQSPDAWKIAALLPPLRLTVIALLLRLNEPALGGSQQLVNILHGIEALLLILAVVVLVYRLIELLVFELAKFAQREGNLLDKSFVQMMRMIARIIVIGIGAIYLLRVISGKTLSTLLAGLGIGGLALALAAQDTLKNFFSSIMIMLDSMLTGHLVTRPNEKLATDSVENIGSRPSIRRLANITITYDTPPEKVEKAVSIIARF